MSSDLATLLNAAATPTTGEPVRKWIWTSALRRERRAAGTLGQGEQAFVALSLNPDEARFRGPRRVNRQNTQGGAVVWHFPDANEEANDLLELTLKLSTDSIDERNPEEALRNLQAWTNLFMLARERELTDDGRPNVRELLFETPAMPFLLLLEGYFEEAPDPQILADKPHSMDDLQCKFIVTGMDPPVREWAATLTTALLGQG